MDARLFKVSLLLSVVGLMGAVHRTPNFVVNAPTAEIAKQVALTAEHYRGELAVQWLGHELPRWSKPCDVSVKVGQVGAGGATTFSFNNGEVYGWRMNVQGSLERILDSVVPHEVSHTILACHFRRPLPRWADEGAATLIEHSSERLRQRKMLEQVYRTPRRIPLRKLLVIKEYPKDMRDVLTLYAEGYSLADYLVQAGGKSMFLKFLDEGDRRGWDGALKKFYGFSNIEALEKQWGGWIACGSPALQLPAGTMIASVSQPWVAPQQPGYVIRSQSPETLPKTKPRESQGRSPTRLAAIDRPSPEESRDRRTLQDAPQNRSTTTALPISDEGRRDRSLLVFGRKRSMNAGWLPVADHEQPANESSDWSDPTFPQKPVAVSANAGRDLSLTDLHVDEDAKAEFRVEQEQPSDGSPNWSAFPRRRASAGSVDLDRVFTDPDSP